MWIIVYGRHYVYSNNKEIRFKTKLFLIAFLVYRYFWCRYILSVYPVKYVKMYLVLDNTVDLKTYSSSYLTRPRGNYESFTDRRPKK